MNVDYKKIFKNKNEKEIEKIDTFLNLIKNIREANYVYVSAIVKVDWINEYNIGLKLESEDDITEIISGTYYEFEDVIVAIDNTWWSIEENKKYDVKIGNSYFMELILEVWTSDDEYKFYNGLYSIYLKLKNLNENLEENYIREIYF